MDTDKLLSARCRLVNTTWRADSKYARRGMTNGGMASSRRELRWRFAYLVGRLEISLCVVSRFRILTRMRATPSRKRVEICRNRRK